MTNDQRSSSRFWALAFVTVLVISLLAGWLGASARGETVAPQALSTQIAPAPLVSDADQGEAAFALQSQIIDIYESASPSVVNITSSSTVAGAFGGTIPQQGAGSGYVYDRQGHIVTNFHVVEDADKVTVAFAGGETYDAEIVGTDPFNDLAVLRIDAGASLPLPLELADSDALKVGQFVLAIGNPFRLDQTLTIGVVSALGRVIESPQDNRFIGEAIQTDAAINPGNSGGPMLDLNGRVIGVNSQIISPSGANAGIGFAVSSNTVARVVPELIASGRYRHPWLGVQLLPLTPAGAEALRAAGMDLPVEAGLLVVQVVNDSPADKAGILGSSRYVQVDGADVPVDGDILTAINGEVAHSYEDVTVYLETETRAGETVELTVLREGSELAVPVTLGELPLD